MVVFFVSITIHNNNMEYERELLWIYNQKYHNENE